MSAPTPTLAHPKLCGCGWPAEYYCCGKPYCEPHYIFHESTCKLTPKGFSK